MNCFWKMAEDQNRERKRERKKRKKKNNTAQNSKAKINSSKIECIFHFTLEALANSTYRRNVPFFFLKRKHFLKPIFALLFQMIQLKHGCINLINNIYLSSTPNWRLITNTWCSRRKAVWQMLTNLRSSYLNMMNSPKKTHFLDLGWTGQWQEETDWPKVVRMTQIFWPKVFFGYHSRTITIFSNLRLNIAMQNHLNVKM